MSPIFCGTSFPGSTGPRCARAPPRWVSAGLAREAGRPPRRNVAMSLQHVQHLSALLARPLPTSPAPPARHPFRLPCPPTGVTDLPEAASEASLEDDAFLKKFHHALLEVQLEEGALVCPETGESPGRQGRVLGPGGVPAGLLRRGEGAWRTRRRPACLRFAQSPALWKSSAAPACLLFRAQGASSPSAAASQTCCSRKTSAEERLRLFSTPTRDLIALLFPPACCCCQFCCSLFHCCSLSQPPLRCCVAHPSCPGCARCRSRTLL